jgi:hypothetical protein
MDKDFLYDAFLICTVREADENDLKFINNYVSKFESEGKKIYYPARDTAQVDSTGGYVICSDNCDAIQHSEEVHVYWTDKSQGTKFDLGMAFFLNQTVGKKIVLANRVSVEEIVSKQKKEGTKKSFEMVLLNLDNFARGQYVPTYYGSGFFSL